MPTPYVPADGITQMEVRFTWNGANVENVLYYDHSAVGFEDATQIAGDNYMLNLWSVLQTKVTSQMTLREIYFTDLTTQTGPTETYVDGLPDAGNVLTDSVANGVALVISARTNGRGRSARGRNFIGGLAEGLKLGSVWVATSVDPILDAYNDFLTSMAASTIPLVVVSRIANGVPRPDAAVRFVTAYAITTYATRSQRRRNPGIGA